MSLDPYFVGDGGLSYLVGDWPGPEPFPLPEEESLVPFFVGDGGWSYLVGDWTGFG